MQTEYFTLEEMLATSTGLPNDPPAALLPKIEDTMRRMDEVREALGKPVRITSGFRSPAVNLRIGGSRTSDHMLGCAVDFVCANMDPKDICNVLLDAYIEFDQLIAEYRNGKRWVHIGFGTKMRRQVLTYRDGKYLTGLV